MPSTVKENSTQLIAPYVLQLWCINVILLCIFLILEAHLMDIRLLEYRNRHINCRTQMVWYAMYVTKSTGIQLPPSHE